MSLSNPDLKNPAQHFFQWAGGAGKLQWYSKEEKKNIDVRLPFTFIVLDQLNTITGYNKKAKSGFWSNEVRNITNDNLYVKTANGPFEAGRYNDLTQTLKSGGKFAKSIYVAHKIGDDWHIGNIKAAGSALSAWIDFTKAHAVDTGLISMKRGVKEESPVGEFYPPVFEWQQWEDEDYKIAIELDKELQIYLNQYLAQPKDGELEPEIEEIPDEVGKATPEEIADFEKKKAEAKQVKDEEPLPPEPDEIIEDLGEEPINLDDIPF